MNKQEYEFFTFIFIFQQYIRPLKGSMTSSDKDTIFMNTEVSEPKSIIKLISYFYLFSFFVLNIQICSFVLLFQQIYLFHMTFNRELTTRSQSTQVKLNLQAFLNYVRKIF